jgi:hypothetical protein
LEEQLDHEKAPQSQRDIGSKTWLKGALDFLEKRECL